MTERTVTTTAAHKAFCDDVRELLNKHSGHLPAVEMLALSAHLVGQITAMQDQRAVTPQIALGIISRNIEAGNDSVVAEILQPVGKA